MQDRMHLTVFGRESDVARSPRNHWWNLEQIFEDLANNRTFSAWKGLEAIRYSNVLPAQVVSDVSVLICQQWTQPGVPLERPCDYLRLTSNGRAGLPVMRTLKPQNLPPRYPFEMMLPDITGSANDIAFLGDVLGRPEFTGPAPRLRLRLGPVDVHRSRMMVAAMATKAEKLLSVLQHRMAIPLYSFSFPKKFSIR